MSRAPLRHQRQRRPIARPPDTPERLLLLWTAPRIAAHPPRFVRSLAHKSGRQNRVPPERAERVAGDALKAIEREERKGAGRPTSRQANKRIGSHGETQFQAALKEVNIGRATASRWQHVAEVGTGKAERTGANGGRRPHRNETQHAKNQMSRLSEEGGHTRDPLDQAIWRACVAHG